MSDLERLIKLFISQTRWGIHPLKVLVALLLPVLLLWTADRRIRRSSGVAADRDEVLGDAERAGSMRGT